MSLTCPQCGEQNQDDAKMCSMCGVALPKAAVATQSVPPSPIPMQQPMTRPVSGYSAGMAMNVEYAGFWLRFVAYIIDLILLSIVGGFFGVIAGVIIGIRAAAGGASSASASAAAAAGAITGVMIVYAVVFVICWLYFALMESSAIQGTVGKLALGLKVTDLDGQPISFGRASGRFFGKLVSGILCIGFIMAGFTEKKQGLHDMMAGCLVVKK